MDSLAPAACAPKSQKEEKIEALESKTQRKDPKISAMSPSLGPQRWVKWNEDTSVTKNEIFNSMVNEVSIKRYVEYNACAVNLTPDLCQHGVK